MTEEKYLCELTQRIWSFYLLDPTKKNFEEMFSYFSNQMVLIGTGKHEIFTNLEQVSENLAANQVEAEHISFQVLDEWYECMKISNDSYLVYGGLWARQCQPIEETLIDMDTRFSVLYRRSEEGKAHSTWEVMHIHHSVPYLEQQKGEYYPKILIEKANDALNMAQLFKRKSEMDLMTEVYNNESFKLYVNKRLESSVSGNLYLFDLDHFKLVNDTYGHMAGDELLKLFAAFLKEQFHTDTIIGRMGGDEFAVYESNPIKKEQMISKIIGMQKAFEHLTQKFLGQILTSYSVGIASFEPMATYPELYEKADRSLYRAKQIGRQTYVWYE